MCKVKGCNAEGYVLGYCEAHALERLPEAKANAFDVLALSLSELYGMMLEAALRGELDDNTFADIEESVQFCIRLLTPEYHEAYR